MWLGNAVTSSTLLADPPSNETIDVFYIHNNNNSNNNNLIINNNYEDFFGQGVLYATQCCKSGRLSEWQQTWTRCDLCARVPKVKGTHVTGRFARAEGLNNL